MARILLDLQVSDRVCLLQYHPTIIELYYENLDTEPIPISGNRFMLSVCGTKLAIENKSKYLFYDLTENTPVLIGKCSQKSKMSVTKYWMNNETILLHGNNSIDSLNVRTHKVNHLVANHPCALSVALFQGKLLYWWEATYINISYNGRPKCTSGPLVKLMVFDKYFVVVTHTRLMKYDSNFVGHEVLKVSDDHFSDCLITPTGFAIIGNEYAYHFNSLGGIMNKTKKTTVSNVYYFGVHELRITEDKLLELTNRK